MDTATEAEVINAVSFCVRATEASTNGSIPLRREKVVLGNNKGLDVQVPKWYHQTLKVREWVFPMRFQTMF